ncbi:AfsR/SARP family transcriptional regulator [Amycolatopsis suaedae]|uniref:AfsR/SARP family transcriptional regulator n=1 Tax=Amycolatopsis suaedae TaxID=2510978 RepID=UPI0013EF096B|nr:BTAD domain-containing putative transcriptional regulator [Amycolatopsis suaedae]
MGVSFEVLGPLRVVVDGEPVALPRGRVAALLACLLARPNELVPLGRLRGWLWDDEPRDPRGAIQTAVRRLRAGVGHDVVRTGPGGYTVPATPAELDLLRFRSLADTARRHEERGARGEAARLAGLALGLWRGPAFADVDAPGFRREVVPRLENERVLATLLWARTLGDRAAAITELARLTAEHPSRQDLSEALIRLLHHVGRRAEALAEYRRISGLLSTGVGPALRELHRSVLGDVAREPATTVPPAELPSDLTGFSGRDRELSQLDSWLHAGGTAVVTGPPGVGKTALAVHWAHRAAARFPDGQLFVDLRGWAPGQPRTPGATLRYLLGSLGVPAGRIPADPGQAEALYRRTLAGKRMLVVLDNAANAGQVRTLLPDTPGVATIVTSRDGLHQLPANRLTLDVPTAREAVAILAGILPTGAGHADLPELSELCGRLPLALRIAGANVASRPDASPRAYLDELRDGRLDALEVTGDRDAAVRAAFDASYQRLPPPARRLFRLFGTAPGADVSAAAAGALAATAPRTTRRHLDALTAAQLLRETAPGRFAMHDLLREYAAERAHATDRDTELRQARTRLHDWYLHSTDNAIRALDPAIAYAPLPPVPCGLRPAAPRDQRDAKRWLDAEQDNLVATILDAATGSGAHAWQLTFTLGTYFHSARPLEAWRAAAEAAYTAADTAVARVAALAGLAHLHHCTGDYAEAIAHAERAVPLLDEADWPTGECAIRWLLGMAHQHTGSLDTAAAQHRRVLTLTDRHAFTFHNLSTIAEQAGRLDEAMDYADRVFRESVAAGDDVGVAAALLATGRVHHHRGNLAEAEEALLRAYALVSGLDPLATARAELSLARLHVDQGRHADAADHAARVLRFAESAADRPSQAGARYVTAMVELHQGNAGAAAAQLTEALALAERSRLGYATVELLIGLAAAEDRADRALGHLGRALDLSGRVGCRGLAALAHLVRATVLRAIDADAAAEAARAAVTISGATGHRLVHARALAEVREA